jgi:YHS domain-containing protein
MIRALVYLLIGIFLITFLRMVIGILMRGMGEALSQRPAGQNPQGGSSAPPMSGELKRDPVCGTFVPASTSFQKSVKGQPYYFCSAECRDKYA